MNPPPELEIVDLPNAAAWREWLAAHGTSTAAVWLKFAKKGSPRVTVTYAQALEEALCHGWIDGQVRRFDAHFYLQRFTPRAPRSQWSKINTEHIARLTAQGRMRPAGIAAVRAAQADGRWQAAYDPPSRISVPEDLAVALAGHESARRHFEALKKSDRYAFLHRLQNVKRADTRARRIAHYVELLAAGRTLSDR